MRTAIFLATLLLGCSGSNSDSTSSADSAGDAGDAGPALDATAPPRSDGGGGKPHEAGVVDSGSADSGACGDRATHKDCVQCCGDENAGANDTMMKALLACACKADRCATVCATSICASTPMPPGGDGGDPCSACLQGTLAADAGANGCMSDVYTACMADNTCVAYMQCEQTCRSTP